MTGSGVAVSVFAGEVFTPEGATEFAARVHESTCREFGAIVAGAELTVTAFWPDGRRREPGTWDEAFAVFPDRVYATWQARGGAVLQATRGCAGYKGRAVRRVFDALRPVLPAGEPQPLLAQHASLVFANAHPGVPAPPSPNLALASWRGAPDQADGDDDEAGEDPALPEFRLVYQAPGGDAGSDPHAPPSFGHVWVLWRGDEPWCRFMDSAPEVEITRVRVMASMRIRGLTGRGVREWRPVEDDGTTAGYRAILSGAPKPP